MAAVDEKDDNRSFVNIEAGASHEDDTGLQAEKAERFEKDVVMLRSYYFISQPADTTFFDMHRLVQLATKKWLKGSSQLEYWGSQFICNLDKGFPTSDFENWEICHLLFPHAVVAIDVEVTSRRAVLWQASLLLHSGQYASETGAYADAERMEGRSLESRKRVLGEGHPDTLTSMNNLAGTYMRQGRWDAAEKLQVEVMEKSKEALREGHPDTLGSMNNLAATYLRQGQWEEAEKLQVEVMEESKEVLGEVHPDTLRSINNLVMTYSDQGQ
jgi:tetratricopeptide (TPR) repeat protein